MWVPLAVGVQPVCQPWGGGGALVTALFFLLAKCVPPTILVKGVFGLWGCGCGCVGSGVQGFGSIPGIRRFLALKETARAAALNILVSNPLWARCQMTFHRVTGQIPYI